MMGRSWLELIFDRAVDILAVIGAITVLFIVANCVGGM